MDTQLESATSGHDSAADDLECLFSNSFGMICAAGFDGKFQRLSPAWTTGLGWSLEELRATPLLELVHPHDRAATAADWKTLTRATGTVVFENRCRCEDGSYIFLQWNANSTLDRRTVFAFVQDISPQRQLELDMLHAQDATLDRIGRELHDNIGPTLSGVTALATGLTAQLHSADRLESCAAGEIRDLLRKTSRVARDLAHGLSPASLDAPSLNAALKQLATNVGVFYGIDCAFNGRLPSLGENRDAGRHLLRVAQEAVNNAVRHGAPTGVRIALDHDADWGRLRIEDDGTGFPREVLKLRGMGLRTMEYRARAIGGSLQIGSAAPRGGRVTCSFPLSAATPTNAP